MSIGNLKDSGNQGNNFPYQLKSLQGLQQIIDALGGGGDLAVLLNPQPRTHNIKRDTLPGTIVKPYSFSIANVGAANGDVEGEILSPGEVINFDAGALNNLFDNVTYDATGTEFLITWVS
jgi:hypothetical protein